MAYVSYDDWYNQRISKALGSGSTAFDGAFGSTLSQILAQTGSQPEYSGVDDPALKKITASELIGGINGQGIPAGITPDQILDHFKQQGGWEARPSPYDQGGLFGQVKELGGPVAWLGASAVGGPVAGTIAAANGSGATQALGVDPRLTTAAGLAYGAYNSNPMGSTPDANVAGSEYGATSTAPSENYWNNTYAANNTGTITDATNGASPAGEPGMWDWLDNIGSSGPDTFSTNPSFSDLGGNIDPNTGMPVDPTGGAGGAMDQFGSVASPNGLGTQGNIGDNYSSPGLMDYLKQFGSQGAQLFKAIQGIRGAGGGAGGGAPGTSAGGGILDSILNNPGQAAFNASPFLLAAYQANKQSGDLNGVLNSINGDAYTKSVLNPYDTDTGQQRYAMQNDQALRGVSGSSFGDQSLNNFDYTRAMGRSDMASKAQLAAAGLQGNLINQRNTNTNLLLGAGLGASGSLFKPNNPLKDFVDSLRQAGGAF